MADARERLSASERKRRKRAVDAKRHASTVNIGDSIARWKRVRDRLTLDNEDLAAVLLEYYEEHKNCRRLAASTPLSLRRERSDTDSERSVCLSGIQSLGSSDCEQMEVTQESDSCELDETLIYGLEEETYEELLTSSLDAGAALDPDDHTWEPSMNLIHLPGDSLLNDNQPEGCPAEDVFDVNFDHPDGMESDDEEWVSSSVKTGRSGFLLQNDAREAANAEKCIAYKCCLMNLASLYIISTCTAKGCKKQVQITSYRKGTALYLSWVCKDGHCNRNWCSQPKLPRGVQAGDFALAATILLSGNNYQKVAMLCKFLNLGCVNRSSFNRIQTLYACPSINKYWDSCLQESLEKARGKQLVVAGDGRMDSPGFSAKYCTYTMLAIDTLDIVSMQIIDKRQTQLKSPTMETKGFKDAIAEMKKKNLDIQEIITDAHPSISAHMRKNEPILKHSWDVWHGAKNLSKKLAALAVYKANRPLQPWRGDIIKHFWHSCETCGEDEIELRKKWTGVLHHVTGTHEWIFGQCEHGPLGEDLEGEKAYVNPDSDAHKALREFVLDDRLLRNLGYYANYRSTAELEGFQNHILMYAGKRFAYSFQVYKSRCQLAGIDYQKHKDRSLLKAKDGSARYQRSYNKNSMRWTAYPLKEDKQYEYIPELMEDIFKSRIEDTGRITRRVEVMADDPCLLSRTIAPIPPPPTKDIFKRQKSRFEQKKDN